MSGKELYEKLKGMGVSFEDNFQIVELSRGFKPTTFEIENYEEMQIQRCDYILSKYDVVFSEDNRVGFTRREYTLAVVELLEIVEGK